MKLKQLLDVLDDKQVITVYKEEELYSKEEGTELVPNIIYSGKLFEIKVYQWEKKEVVKVFGVTNDSGKVDIVILVNDEKQNS